MDESCDRLLELLYELPKDALTQIDDFVNELYTQIISLPEKNDGGKRTINLVCKLDGFNDDELTEELNYVDSKI